MKKIRLFVIVSICLLSLFLLAACTNQQGMRANVAAKADPTEEEVVDPVVDEENEEEEQEEVGDVNEPVDEEALKVEILVEKVLEVKGVSGKIEDEELKALVEAVLALDFEDEKTVLVVAAVVLNPGLEVEDVKDLNEKVLAALCDKPEEKIVYASYQSYKKALKELEEKFAYMYELEDKTYEYAFELLEDLSDEAFDEVVNLLKEAKAAYKEAVELYEAEKEALDILYADVIANHKGNGCHGEGKGHKFGFDYEYKYDFGFNKFDSEDFFDDFDFEGILEGFDFEDFFGACEGQAVKDGQKVRQGKYGF